MATNPTSKSITSGPVSWSDFLIKSVQSNPQFTVAGDSVTPVKYVNPDNERQDSFLKSWNDQVELTIPISDLGMNKDGQLNLPVGATLNQQNAGLEPLNVKGSIVGSGYTDTARMVVPRGQTASLAGYFPNATIKDSQLGDLAPTLRDLYMSPKEGSSFKGTDLYKNSDYNKFITDPGDVKMNYVVNKQGGERGVMLSALPSQSALFGNIDQINSVKEMLIKNGVVQNGEQANALVANFFIQPKVDNTNIEKYQKSILEGFNNFNAGYVANTKNQSSLDYVAELLNLDKNNLDLGTNANILIRDNATNEQQIRKNGDWLQQTASNPLENFQGKTQSAGNLLDETPGLDAIIVAGKTTVNTATNALSLVASTVASGIALTGTMTADNLLATGGVKSDGKRQEEIKSGIAQGWSEVGTNISQLFQGQLSLADFREKGIIPGTAVDKVIAGGTGLGTPNSSKIDWQIGPVRVTNDGLVKATKEIINFGSQMLLGSGVAAIPKTLGTANSANKVIQAGNYLAKITPFALGGNTVDENGKPLSTSQLYTQAATSYVALSAMRGITMAGTAVASKMFPNGMGRFYAGLGAKIGTGAMGADDAANLAKIYTPEAVDAIQVGLNKLVGMNSLGGRLTNGLLQGLNIFTAGVLTQAGLAAVTSSVATGELPKDFWTPFQSIDYAQGAIYGIGFGLVPSLISGNQLYRNQIINDIQKNSSLKVTGDLAKAEQIIADNVYSGTRNVDLKITMPGGIANYDSFSPKLFSDQAGNPVGVNFAKTQLLSAIKQELNNTNIPSSQIKGTVTVSSFVPIEAMKVPIGKELFRVLGDQGARLYAVTVDTSALPASSAPLGSSAAAATTNSLRLGATGKANQEPDPSSKMTKIFAVLDDGNGGKKIIPESEIFSDKNSKINQAFVYEQQAKQVIQPLVEAGVLKSLSDSKVKTLFYNDDVGANIFTMPTDKGLNYTQLYSNDGNLEVRSYPGDISKLTEAGNANQALAKIADPIFKIILPVISDSPESPLFKAITQAQRDPQNVREALGIIDLQFKVEADAQLGIVPQVKGKVIAQTSQEQIYVEMSQFIRPKVLEKFAENPRAGFYKIVNEVQNLPAGQGNNLKAVLADALERADPELQIIDLVNEYKQSLEQPVKKDIELSEKAKTVDISKGDAKDSGAAAKPIKVKSGLLLPEKNRATDPIKESKINWQSVLPEKAKKTLEDLRQENKDLIKNKPDGYKSLVFKNNQRIEALKENAKKEFAQKTVPQKPVEKSLPVKLEPVGAKPTGFTVSKSSKPIKVKTRNNTELFEQPQKEVEVPKVEKKIAVKPVEPVSNKKQVVSSTNQKKPIVAPLPKQTEAIKPIQVVTKKPVEVKPIQIVTKKPVEVKPVVVPRTDIVKGLSPQEQLGALRNKIKDLDPNNLEDKKIIDFTTNQINKLRNSYPSLAKTPAELAEEARIKNIENEKYSKLVAEADEEALLVNKEKRDIIKNQKKWVETIFAISKRDNVEVSDIVENSLERSNPEAAIEVVKEVSKELSSRLALISLNKGELEESINDLQQANVNWKVITGTGVDPKERSAEQNAAQRIIKAGAVANLGRITSDSLKNDTGNAYSLVRASSPYFNENDDASTVIEKLQEIYRFIEKNENQIKEFKKDIEDNLIASIVVRKIMQPSYLTDNEILNRVLDDQYQEGINLYDQITTRLAERPNQPATSSGDVEAAIEQKPQTPKPPVKQSEAEQQASESGFKGLTKDQAIAEITTQIDTQPLDGSDPSAFIQKLKADYPNRKDLLKYAESEIDRALRDNGQMALGQEPSVFDEMVKSGGIVKKAPEATKESITKVSDQASLGMSVEADFGALQPDNKPNNNDRQNTTIDAGAQTASDQRDTESRPQRISSSNGNETRAKQDEQVSKYGARNVAEGTSPDWVDTGTIRERLGLGPRANQFEVNQAIEAKIKAMDEQGLTYSDSDKEVISSYAGAGGLAKQGATGKGLLSEYYTNDAIVKTMWGLVKKYGFTKGAVIEPAVGIGNFLKYSSSENTVDGFEINQTSRRITSILYPRSNISGKSFEILFIEKNTSVKNYTGKQYDLNIGNPPYGEYNSFYAGMGENQKGAIKQFEHYFISRGLDVLKENGILAYIIPSSFLQNTNQYNKVKEIINAKADFVDAYRLPTGVFETTEIGTDIIIFRKKQNPTTPIPLNDGWFTSNPSKVLGEIVEVKNQFGDLVKMVKNPEKDINKILSSIDVTIPNREQVTASVFDSAFFEDVENKKILTPTEADSLTKTVEQNKPKETKPSAVKPPANGISTDTARELGMYTKEESDVLFNQGDARSAAITDSEKQVFYNSTYDKAGDLVYTGDNKDVYLQNGDLAIYKNKYVPGIIYYSGNIYDKLDTLENDFADQNISENVYNNQKRILESKLPKVLTIDAYDPANRISLIPVANFAEVWEVSTNLDGTPISDMSRTLKAEFKSWMRELDNSSFTGQVSAETIISYYLRNDSIIGDDQEKKAIRQINKEQGNNLFIEFLKTGISDVEKDLINKKWNRDFNGLHQLDYRRIPFRIETSTTFKGKPLAPRVTQREAIGFIQVKGSGILALDTGLGKTMSAIMAVEQMLEENRSSRPLFVVPSKVLEKWVSEIREILPHREINVLGNLGVDILKKNPNPKVKDGSITIMTYQGSAKLEFSAKMLEAAKGDLDWATYQGTSTIKQQALLQAQVEKLLGKGQSGGEFSLEKFGFDAVVYDEAHAAKKVFPGVKSKIKRYEMSVSPSKVGLKAYMLTQHISRMNNGRNVVLLTATPFSNSPLEIYTMLSLVGTKKLEELGIKNLNQFFDTFIKTESKLVASAKLEFKREEIVRSFSNLQALQSLIREFMLYRTSESTGIKLPNKVTSTPALQLSDLQAEQLDSLQNFVFNNNGLEEIEFEAGDNKGDDGNDAGGESSEDTKKVGKKPSKLRGGDKNSALTLTLITLGRMSATSPYFVPGLLNGQNPNPDYKTFVENSPKIKFALDSIKSVKDYHIKNNEEVSGQVIYLNAGNKFFPKIKEYLVNELKFKPEEVGIMSSKPSPAARERIKADFLKGKVKVIIGSNVILEGVDLQDKASTLYNLSLDWNPTDIKQLEGRIHRFGNQHKNVRIVTPVMEDSIDIFVLQKLGDKTSRLNNLLAVSGNTFNLEDFNPDELKEGLVRDPNKLVNLKIELELGRINVDIVNITAKIKTLEEIKSLPLEVEANRKGFDRYAPTYLKESLQNLSNEELALKKTKDFGYSLSNATQEYLKLLGKSLKKLNTAVEKNLTIQGKTFEDIDTSIAEMQAEIDQYKADKIEIESPENRIAMLEKILAEREAKQLEFKTADQLLADFESQNPDLLQKEGVKYRESNTPSETVQGAAYTVDGKKTIAVNVGLRTVDPTDVKANIEAVNTLAHEGGHHFADTLSSGEATTFLESVGKFTDEFGKNQDYTKADEAATEYLAQKMVIDEYNNDSTKMPEAIKKATSLWERFKNFMAKMWQGVQNLLGNKVKATDPIAEELQRSINDLVKKYDIDVNKLNPLSEKYKKWVDSGTVEPSKAAALAKNTSGVTNNSLENQKGLEKIKQIYSDLKTKLEAKGIQVNEFDGLTKGQVGDLASGNDSKLRSKADKASQEQGEPFIDPDYLQEQLDQMEQAAKDLNSGNIIVEDKPVDKPSGPTPQQTKAVEQAISKAQTKLPPKSFQGRIIKSLEGVTNGYNIALGSASDAADRMFEKAGISKEVRAQIDAFADKAKESDSYKYMENWVAESQRFERSNLGTLSLSKLSGSELRAAYIMADTQKASNGELQINPYAKSQITIDNIDTNTPEGTKQLDDIILELTKEGSVVDPQDIIFSPTKKSVYIAYQINPELGKKLAAKIQNAPKSQRDFIQKYAKGNFERTKLALQDNIISQANINMAPMNVRFDTVQLSNKPGSSNPSNTKGKNTQLQGRVITGNDYIKNGYTTSQNLMKEQEKILDTAEKLKVIPFVLTSKTKDGLSAGMPIEEYDKMKDAGIDVSFYNTTVDIPRLGKFAMNSDIVNALHKLGYVNQGTETFIVEEAAKGLNTLLSIPVINSTNRLVRETYVALFSSVKNIAMDGVSGAVQASLNISSNFITGAAIDMATLGKHGMTGSNIQALVFASRSIGAFWKRNFLKALYPNITPDLEKKLRIALDMGSDSTGVEIGQIDQMTTRLKNNAIVNGVAGAIDFLSDSVRLLRRPADALRTNIVDALSLYNNSFLLAKRLSVTGINPLEATAFEIAMARKYLLDRGMNSGGAKENMPESYRVIQKATGATNLATTLFSGVQTIVPLGWAANNINKLGKMIDSTAKDLDDLRKSNISDKEKTVRLNDIMDRWAVLASTIFILSGGLASMAMQMQGVDDDELDRLKKLNPEVGSGYGSNSYYGNVYPVYDPKSGRYVLINIDRTLESPASAAKALLGMLPFGVGQAITGDQPFPDLNKNKTMEEKVGAIVGQPFKLYEDLAKILQPETAKGRTPLYKAAEESGAKAIVGTATPNIIGLLQNKGLISDTGTVTSRISTTYDEKGKKIEINADITPQEKWLNILTGGQIIDPLLLDLNMIKTASGIGRELKTIENKLGKGEITVDKAISGIKLLQERSIAAGLVAPDMPIDKAVGEMSSFRPSGGGGTKVSRSGGGSGGGSPTKGRSAPKISSSRPKSTKVRKIGSSKTPKLKKVSFKTPKVKRVSVKSIKVIKSVKMKSTSFKAPSIKMGKVKTPKMAAIKITTPKIKKLAPIRTPKLKPLGKLKIDR